MLQREQRRKKMDIKTLESILNEIDYLNERTLDICYVGNRQFMDEYKFIHESIEDLIRIRNDEAYDNYDIQGYIEIAGRLEEVIYAEEYNRRKYGS